MSENLLRALYTTLDSPSGLASLSDLHKLAVRKDPAISRKDVEEFLKGVDSYTLYKPTPHIFSRRPMYFRMPGDTIVMDVMYLTPLSPKIKHRYGLVAIDGFSRYATVILLKNLKAETVAPEFEKFLENNVYGYRKVLSDSGVEFLSGKMKTLYKKYNLHWYTNPSPHKTSICERFIKTLKIKLAKFVTHFNSEDLEPAIPKLVLAYNLREHSSLNNESPLNVHLLYKWEDIENFASPLYKKKHAKIKPVRRAHRLNTVVRLKLTSRVFGQRASHILNTKELFKISEVKKTHPITYSVKPLDVKDAVEGSFYHQELIPVNDSGFYKIEILKQKKKGKNTIYLVKYLDYPEAKPAWVTKKMLKKL